MQLAMSYELAPLAHFVFSASYLYNTSYLDQSDIDVFPLQVQTSDPQQVLVQQQRRHWVCHVEKN